MLEPFSAALHAEELGANGSQPAAAAAETADVIQILDEEPTSSSPLLALDAVTLRSPDGSTTLVQDLSLQVSMQPSQGSCTDKPASPLDQTMTQSPVAVAVSRSCAAGICLVRLGDDTFPLYGACLCQQQSAGYTGYVTLPTRCQASQVPCFCEWQVHQDETLLIVGPSGAGKTSILRAIAGLWTSGSGTIRRSRSTVSPVFPSTQSYELATMQDRCFPWQLVDTASIDSASDRFMPVCQVRSPGDCWVTQRRHILRATAAVCCAWNAQGAAAVSDLVSLCS